MGRVVLESAVTRRVVGRRNYDAVGQPLFAAAVVTEDGVGDDRGRSEAVVTLDHRLDAVGRQYLERRALGRGRHGVGVLAHEKGTIGSLAASVLTDRLGDGQNVRLGECVLLGRPAMAAGAEMNQLLWVACIRPARVIFVQKPVDVNQQLSRGRLTGERG